MAAVECVLFSKLVREKSLRHPTARNFSADAWLEAARDLVNPTERDIQLSFAAIHYGTQIKELRARFEKELFPDFDRRSGILLSLAMANYNDAIVGEKGKKAAKALVANRGFVPLGGFNQVTIGSSYPGNESTPDAAITAIVDSLPHCLERANALPQTAPRTVHNYWNVGAKLFSTMSIEHALRDLWQQILWDGWQLSKIGNDLRQDPIDRELAEFWTAWYARHEKILGQRTNLDAITEKANRLDGQFPEPFLKSTVVAIGGSSRETRRFRFGQVSGLQISQGWHRTESTILDSSYLAQFLDSVLPDLGKDLSCRKLHTAWCVLRDCANILNNRVGKLSLENAASIEARALTIQRDELIGASRYVPAWISSKQTQLFNSLLAISTISELYSLRGSGLRHLSP